jgi:hypothetical protein
MRFTTPHPSLRRHGVKQYAISYTPSCDLSLQLYLDIMGDILGCSETLVYALFALNVFQVSRQLLCWIVNASLADLPRLTRHIGVKESTWTLYFCYFYQPIISVCHVM